MISAQENKTVPISFNQKYFWELDKKYPGKNINNIAGAYKIIGDLNSDKFVNAINKITERHEILRTSFYEKESGVYQNVVDIDHSLVEFEDLSTMGKEEIQKLIDTKKERICLKPFDLTTEITSRFLLIKTGEKEHIFLYAIHHIAFDGWSFGIFINELNSFYNSDGNTNEIPKPLIKYTDYSISQHKWFEEGILEKQLNYWKQNLSKYDFSGCKSPSSGLETATKRITIDSNETEKLMQICRKKDISLFMLLLTGFAEILKEVKNKSEITIGTYIAGREHSELENLIGCFINILPLRIENLDERETGANFEEIRNVCLDAYKNQSVPLNIVLKNLETYNVDVTQFPNTMFVLQNNKVGELKLGTAKLEAISLRHIDSPYALQCSVFHENSSLVAAFTYHKLQYHTYIIEEILDNYKQKLLFYTKIF